MDLNTINKFDKAKEKTLSSFAKLSLALLFMVVVFLWSYTSNGDVPNNTFLIIGAVFGAYMAMNIGANDVANNVGPAVGSKALTMFWAIVIAAVFEALGSFIAGGEVVKTIKNGIIDPALIANPEVFIWAMTAALLSAALWLNFATSVGAPVSTTHSIVGGVMGGGIAAAGFSIVNWDTMTEIVSSWVISPVLGAVVAAGFLYFIKKQIIYKEDKITAAIKFVPILIAIMTWSFGTYIILKGLKELIKLDFYTAGSIALVLAVVSFFWSKKLILKAALKLENNRTSVNSLFTIPLIFSAALLSFAHGANDVANAIGPLAAINDAILNSEISSKASIPFWVMAVGAFGIVVGLIWNWIYQGDYGLLNTWLDKLGLGNWKRAWLADPNTALTALSVVHMWKGFGWGFIILLAGLQGIPRDLYEAARVDGAGETRIFWKITVPLMIPVFILVSVLTILGTMQIYDLVITTTRGGPGSHTEVPMKRILDEITPGSRLGYACSLGVVFGAVLLLLSMLQIQLSKRVKAE